MLMSLIPILFEDNEEVYIILFSQEHPRFYILYECAYETIPLLHHHHVL